MTTIECSWMVDAGEAPLIFTAVSLDPTLPLGACPNVDETTRDVLLSALGNDQELAAIEPSIDGLYHLGSLGWTFGIVA